MKLSQLSLLMTTVLIAPHIDVLGSVVLATVWLVTAITAAINE
jgi:hypothetical protein